LRETATCVRELLSGERLPNPINGARPLRLGASVDVPIPIALAALSASSIRLTGEVADEWVPFLWARSRIDEARALLHVGESSTEAPSPTRVCPAIPVALASDEETARELAGWWLSTYATRMGPLYPQMLSERFGVGAQLNAVVEASDGGRRPSLPTTAADLAAEVTLMGTYDEVGDKIAAWSQAGADAVNLTLPPGRPEPELLEIVDAAARHVVHTPDAAVTH
jgi:alkanesulfonate monooxygenase SsuD/methylene tetrahydromethanopterin reductase-like flavin-dependent oxidoreductase (luciferase family)